MLYVCIENKNEKKISMHVNSKNLIHHFVYVPGGSRRQNHVVHGNSAM